MFAGRRAPSRPHGRGLRATNKVKSKSGKARSMRELITSKSYPEIRFGIKFSANNIGSNSHLFTAPCFTAFLTRRLIEAYDDGNAPSLDNPESE